MNGTCSWGPVIQDLTSTSGWRMPKCGSHMPISGISEILANLTRALGWPHANTYMYEAAYRSQELGQNSELSGKIFRSLDQLMPFQMSGGEDRFKRIVGICRYNEPSGVTRTALFRLGLSWSETRRRLPLVRAEALSHIFSMVGQSIFGRKTVLLYIMCTPSLEQHV